MTKDDTMCRHCLHNDKNELHSVMCSKYVVGKDTLTHRCFKCHYETEDVLKMQDHMKEHRKTMLPYEGVM